MKTFLTHLLTLTLFQFAFGADMKPQEFQDLQDTLCAEANASDINYYLSYEKVYSKDDMFPGYESKKLEGISIFVNQTVNITKSKEYVPSIPPQEIICRSIPTESRYNANTKQIEVLKINFKNAFSYKNHYGNLAPVQAQISAEAVKSRMALNELPLYQFITIKMPDKTEKLYFYTDNKIYLFSGESNFCLKGKRGCKGDAKALVTEVSHVHKDIDEETPLYHQDFKTGQKFEIRN